MHRGLFTLFIAACVVSVTTASSTDALELPKPQPVEKYLGKSAAGANYTVQPIVRSDGVMRIFDVDTPYGKFAFDGVEFTKLRLHELDAVAAIEKMSQSEAFGQAFGRAALGPIKFGTDLITKPVDTVERSLSGIGNMFDQIGENVSIGVLRAGIRAGRAGADQIRHRPDYQAGRYSRTLPERYRQHVRSHRRRTVECPRRPRQRGR